MGPIAARLCPCCGRSRSARDSLAPVAPEQPRIAARRSERVVTPVEGPRRPASRGASRIFDAPIAVESAVDVNLVEQARSH